MPEGRVKDPALLLLDRHQHRLMAPRGLQFRRVAARDQDHRFFKVRDTPDRTMVSRSGLVLTALM